MHELSFEDYSFKNLALASNVAGSAELLMLYKRLDQIKGLVWFKKFNYATL